MTDGSVVVQAIAGVPLVLLGVAVLFLPRRRADALLLAGFCVLWGAGVEVISLGFALNVPRDLAAPLTFLYEAANVPAAACLVGFVAWMRVRRARRALMTTIVAALALVGLAGALVGSSVVATDAYLAGFSLALVLAYRSYRRALPGTSRQRERFLVAALTLMPAYLLSSFAAAYGNGGLVFFLPLLPVAAVHAHALARPPPPERRDWWLSLAFFLPLAAGAANVLAIPGYGAGMGGFWRIATAALLAFAIARTRLFDVELRLRRAAGPTLAGLALAAGLVAGGILLIEGESAWSSAVAPVGGAGVGLMLLAARGPLGEAIFPVDASEAYVRERKLEVYAAADHAATQAGLGADDHEVRRLRRSFGVADAEHAAILAAATPRDTRRLVLSRYRLQHALGDGGQGSAFLARDERTGAEVAVKLVSRYAASGAAADALLREAKLASSLEHRNIVRVLAANVDGDDAALVMEYASGGSLRGLLRRRGPALPPDEAARIVDDVLSALAACHARGIVHGDVKPENVLLDAASPPRAMLADFGVARDVAGATAATGAAVGTLLYMAPEQVRGQPARPESDVYAACVVLHEALTGRHHLPIAGRDDFQIRQLILDGAGPELAMRGDAARYADALRAGLAVRPEERPSAAEMRARLGAPLVKARA